MTDFTDHDFALLEAVLAEHFLPHLPVLAANNKTDEECRKKDLSRALSAFALSHLVGLGSEAAAREVVDDFEDCGIDAVHFCPIHNTLYIVQAKLKKGEEFKEAEAQKFTMGVRKLMVSDFAAFNAHVVARQPELQSAIEDCDRVQLVVIYTGTRISAHAAAALNALMAGEGTEEARFVDPFSDVGPEVKRRSVVGRSREQQVILALAQRLDRQHRRCEPARLTFQEFDLGNAPFMARIIEGDLGDG